MDTICDSPSLILVTSNHRAWLLANCDIVSTVDEHCIHSWVDWSMHPCRTACDGHMVWLTSWQDGRVDSSAADGTGISQANIGGDDHIMMVWPKSIRLGGNNLDDTISNC